MFTIFLSFSFAKKKPAVVNAVFSSKDENYQKKERKKKVNNIKESLKKVPKALSVKRESCNVFTES